MDADKRAIVSLDGVRKSFAGRPVIRTTSLEVAEGERLAIIGPSGCGKSTLLRMIVGLVTPDAGQVRVDGVVIEPRAARAMRRRIGYVTQDGGLFPHLTAEENVSLVARLDGWDVDKRRARVRELASLARVQEPLLAQYPRALSGGERQRVALMRALMLEPDVLLLDEPLAALDPLVRAALQADLRDAFRALGKSVVLVTHDMAEAAFLAESIAVLRDGEILQRGTMRDLVERPEHAFVRELVGAQRSLAEALA
jgi:osmoprotectant transport system ATP-binding protein